MSVNRLLHRPPMAALAPCVCLRRTTPTAARLHQSTNITLLSIRNQQYGSITFRRPEARARLRAVPEPIDLNNPRNPHDRIGLARAAHKVRNQAKRDVKRAIIGIIVCLGCVAVLITGYELSAESQKRKRLGELKQRSMMRENDTMGARRSSVLPVDRADARSGGAQAEERFRGKPVDVKARGDRIVATDTQTGMEVGEMIPTGTSSVPLFPKTIMLPSETAVTALQQQQDGAEEEYTLLGLGIRTVSFLSIQVYVVGLYVRTVDLQSLQSALINRLNPTASALIPSEKDRLRQDLLDPEQSNQLWDALLRPASTSRASPSSSDSASSTPGIKTALRITPTRNTDFAHLRDGFVRLITARSTAQTKSAPGSGAAAAIDTFDDQAFSSAVDNLKAIFKTRGRAPKGSVLLLARDGSIEGQGALTMLFQERGADGKQVESDAEKDIAAPLQAPAAATAAAANAVTAAVAGADTLSTSKSKEAVVKLGKVEDERIGRLIWLGYLGGKNVSCEPARRNVADGVLKLVERPAGTVVDARVL